MDKVKMIKEWIESYKKLEYHDPDKVKEAEAYLRKLEGTDV